MPQEVDIRKISVAGVPINPHDNTQLLMGYHVDRDGWEFPGGAVKPGESPSQAVIREVKEETGCTPGPFKLLGFMPDDPEWLCLVFAVSLLKVPDEIVPREAAHREWSWFDKCPDGLSANGLFVARKLLHTDVGGPFRIRLPARPKGANKGAKATVR